MSSARKGLRRAGVGGLSALVAATAMTGLAATAQADWPAATPAQIGLVDASATTAGTQGSTLLYPGVSGQELGDVNLLIPNTFKNGDTIDIAVYDRTATATNNGQINADAAHKLGFSSTPTVAVDAQPYTNAASITGASPNNLATSKHTVAPPAIPTTPPAFAASLVQSSRANGLANDILRLKVNAVQSNGQADDQWLVKLSGLKVDLGASVSPGELRLVPFAFNGTPASDFSNASDMFQGNLVDFDRNPATYDPRIATYTVPAYVSPVNFTVGAPNTVVADNTTQRVGDITISETNNFSMQAGTYTVTVAGASVRNDAASPITVTATGAATGETVSSPAVVAGNAISFTLTQTDVAAANSGKLSVKLSGLLLGATAKGAISYTLSGGSVSGAAGTQAFLAGRAGQSALTIANPTPPPANVVSPDTAFSAGVNQTDIVAPPLAVNSVATPVATRIGGGDRYETAGKIAINNGANDYIVLASGEGYADALSSGYLANQIGGGSILLTKKNTLPAVTADAMRLLGTRTVYVVGGTGSVSDAVVAKLRATPQYLPGGEQTVGQGKLQVIRLGGTDRYATNQRINEYAAAVGGGTIGRTNIKFGESSKYTAIVASGEGFADALSAGPLTQRSLPIILTKAGSLSSAAKSQMQNLDVQQAVVVGGNASVSPAAEASITGMGVAVKRLSGVNRFATGAAIASWANASTVPSATTDGGLGFNGSTAYLANGLGYADALAAGPLAGGQGSPILLTPASPLAAETQAWLKDNAALYTRVIGLGLGGSVTTSTLDAANSAISGS